MTPYVLRPRARLGWLVAAVVLIPLACGPFHRQPEEDARLIFANESLEQVHVYAGGPNGNQVRLGAVLPLRVENLRVPAIAMAQDGAVNISARLAGSTVATATSTNFTLSAGDTIRVRLTADQRSILIIPGIR
jgi:hypothetical protein